MTVLRTGIIGLAAAMLCWSPIAGAQSSAESGAGNTPASADADRAGAAKAAAVQRHVDAYRTGSLDRFVATFTADARVEANGMVATGHREIRALYALNFALGAPAIRVTESGFTSTGVFLSVGYVFENGEEMCCSYSEYEVSDGKIALLRSSG